MGQLNDLLDQLAAAAGDQERQAGVLRVLLQKTTPEQMQFVLQIVLKSLKARGRGSLRARAWKGWAGA